MFPQTVLQFFICGHNETVEWKVWDSFKKLFFFFFKVEEDWAELEEKVKRFCQFGTLEILGSVSLSPPPTNSYVETLLAVWWYYKVVFLEVILIRRGPEVEPSWGELVSVQGSQGVLASSLCSLPCEDEQYNLAEGCRLLQLHEAHLLGSGLCSKRGRHEKLRPEKSLCSNEGPAWSKIHEQNYRNP